MADGEGDEEAGAEPGEHRRRHAAAIGGQQRDADRRERGRQQPEVREAARLARVPGRLDVGARRAVRVPCGRVVGGLSGRTVRLGHDRPSYHPRLRRPAVGAIPCYLWGVMCRNIRLLFNFDPPATDAEVRAAAVQFVRKVSGFTRPSQANQAAFDQRGRRGRAVGAAAAGRAGDQRAEPQPRRGSAPRQGAGGQALRDTGRELTPGRLRVRRRARRARSAAGPAAPRPAC